MGQHHNNQTAYQLPAGWHQPTLEERYPNPAYQLLVEWDRLTLEDRYPHPARILTALRLSPDLHTCRELLAGQPVDPARLDQRELARAKNRKLVRLDMTALDQLEAA